jgi:hypothetical protein
VYSVGWRNNARRKVSFLSLVMCLTERFTANSIPSVAAS